ncbi:unnamed protein product [Parnassius apollo]|uniref:(apollo) hypothetical protein n=1 Tax=Parnassius apollo TaxID=110799 RepID=A0A8S3Y2L2_PARAO|nr:unnamed protein product [Parnassius apollo]
MDSMNKSLSDTEVEIAHQTTPPNFLTARKKRRRDEDSERIGKKTSELANLKEKMKNMFLSLMNSQNLEFQKNASILKEIQKTN